MLTGRIKLQGLIVCAMILCGCTDKEENKQSEAVKTQTLKAEPKTPSDGADSSQAPNTHSNGINSSNLTAEKQTLTTGSLIDSPPSELTYQLEKSAMDYSNKALSVLDISERSYDGGNALAVTLSIPLDPSKNYDDYFVLVEQDEGIVSGSPVVSKNGKIVYFPFTKPSTSYQLIVYKGLTGIGGEPLKYDQRQELNTRKIQPAYNFVSKGAFLSLKQHTGLPVVVINTSEVNVDFFKVDNKQVANFLNRHSYFQDKVHRYSAARTLKDASLVYSARYQFDAPANKRREFNLPVQSINEMSETGVYVAVMSLPGDYSQAVKMTYFTVTDIGMHLRVYQNSIDVFTSSLESQQPLKGVEIELIDDKGNSLFLTKTSPDGRASIPKNFDKSQYILARLGHSFSIVSLQGAALDLSEFNLAKRPYRPQELFVYTPRDLYRPGETIDFNALIRDFDGHSVKAPTLVATIQEPGGNNVNKFTWQSETEGFYSHTFQLPMSAKTGLWSLEIKNVGKAIVTYQFKVEEFLPERMKLTYNKDLPAAFNTVNDELTVKVLGEYLYGAPANNNRFESKISFHPKREVFTEHAGFEFGNNKEEGLTGKYNLKDTLLDENGIADLAIENRWRSAKSPVEVTLLGSLFESGGRPITRRFSTTVVPTSDLIGIKPHFTDNPKVNSRVSFDIITTNNKGQLISNDDLEIDLVREDRRYFWEYSESRGWHYQWSDKEYLESSSTVSTNNNAAVSIEFPVEYGRYRLAVKNKNTGVITTFNFFVGQDWYSNWRNKQSGSQASKPDMVSLAWDKESYKAGDIANLSIVPPQAGEAIILIESDKPLFMQRISIPKSGVDLSIKIENDWSRHDIYASVIHLQKGDKVQSITPTRALGLIHLPLDRQDRKLDIELLTDDKIYPNQTYTAKVKVTGNEKLPAYLTLSMVDVGVLSLTNFKTPDPHQFFFEPRRYEVDSRDMYQKIIELNSNQLAKQKFGGDSELSRGGKKAQSEVQVLSLFSGLVNVDKDGFAHIDFKVPNFNGRVKFMVSAFTQNQFGSAEKDMTIAAPVVSQLAMPRFLAVGDQSTIALDLHNLTDTAKDLDINILASAPLSLAKHTKLTLASQEKVTLKYPVQASETVGRSQISLTIDGIEGYPIDRQWLLNVRAAYPSLIKRKQAVLNQGDIFTFDLNEAPELVSESIEVVASLSNTVDFRLNEQMEQLLRYPYGCVEQLTSTSYPWLFATDSILTSLDLSPKSDSLSHRSESIQRGLDRIQEKSLDNGSYALWSNRGREEHWLTAYVGDFLTDARTLGIKINDEAYKLTMERLQDYLREKNSNFSNRWSEDNEHYDFAYRAYAGYVLSRHKKAHLSSLRNLANHKIYYAASPLPLVHLGLALINQGDISKGNEVLTKAKSVERKTEYLADYGSDIRDNAMMIRLLLEHSTDTDFALALSVKLAELLKSKRYLSTQERNAIFLAGISLESTSHKEWQADIKLANAIKTIKHAGSYAIKYNHKQLANGMSITNRHDGPLFVNLSYQGVSKTAPKPASNKLSIERTFYNVDGEKITPEQLRVGELVLVGLRINSDSRNPDVLVVDLLPAGLEIENQNLEHAIKLDDIEIDGKTIKYWLEKANIVHQEYRDDRYVAAIEVNRRSGAYLFYLGRAVTPGKYKVPASLAEDMYRPEINAVGHTLEYLEIINP